MSTRNKLINKISKTLLALVFAAAMLVSGFPLDGLVLSLQESRIVDELYLSKYGSGLQNIVDNLGVKTAQASGGEGMYVGQFTKKTSTGSQSITDVPFQPAAVIFYWTRETIDGGGSNNGNYGGFGMATGASNERALSWWDEDQANNGSTDTGIATYNSESIVFQTDDGALTLGIADFTQFTANGFDINWSVANASAYRINYIAFDSEYVTNATVNTFSLTTGTGNLSVTNAGFQPNFVFMLSGATTSHNANTADLRYTIGAATSASEEWTQAGRSEDAGDFSDTCSVQRTDAVLAMITPTGTSSCDNLDALADFTQFTANGFDINKSDAPAGARDVFYLALATTETMKVGSFNKPTSAQSQEISTVGFEPAGVVFTTNGKASGTTVTAHNYLAFGGTSGGTDEKSIAYVATDNLDASEPRTRNLTTKAITIMKTNNSTNASSEADLTSLDSDGFTLDWTTSDGVADEIHYFAMEQKPSTVLGDGTDPGNSTIAPGASVTDIDAFTLQTTVGTDTVTDVIATLSPANSYENIAKVEITNNSNVDVCTDIDNPSSVTLDFSGCSLSVTTSATTYKIRITPKTHANMPAVPGASYGTTATVTTIVATNTTTGSDTDSATITVDNASPGAFTGIADSYSESNQSSSLSSVQGHAQTFAGNGGTLSRVQLYLQKSGTINGTLSIQIFATSGTYGTDSIPTGSILATSDSFDVTTLTTSYQLIEFNFSGGNQITLTNGTKYAIVVPTFGLSGNRVVIATDNTSPSHGGNIASDAGGWVPSSASDMIFYVSTGGGATAAAGDSQVNLSWGNPSDSDFTTGGTVVVLRRASSAVADVPVEGTSYSVGNTIGTATVACVVTGSPPATSCTDSSLSNGTAYHYKFFAQDSRGNYTAGTVPTGSPATPAVAGISISGTSSGLSDGVIVRVAVNGSLSGQTGVISSNAWSVTGVTGVDSGEAVVVFVTDGDGDIADSSEAVAVTKYDGTGNITGMVLAPITLSIGSADNASVSLTDMETYDCDNDEDVFFGTSASNTLLGEGCSSTAVNETISILSGNTYTIAADNLLITHHLTNSGTLTQTGGAAINVGGTFTSSGTFNGGGGSIDVVDLTISGGTFTSTSSILTLSGNYSNSGTFTNNSGTVTFTATDTGNTIGGTLSGTSDFSKLVFNGSGGEWTLGANLETDGASATAISIAAGTLKNGGYSITGNGATDTFSVSNGAFFEMSGTSAYPASFSTYTFGPTSTVRYYQSTVTVTAATYGHLTLGNGSGTITLPNSTITLYGNLVVANGTTVTKGSGTLLFTGGTTQTITDNNGTKQDLGNIQISGGAGGGGIAFDTATQGGGGTDPTFSHTVTGSDALLLVSIRSASGVSAPTAVSYNSQALTKLTETSGYEGDGSGGHVQIWGILIPSPDGASHTVSVTGETWGVVAASYTGVYQSALPDITNTKISGTNPNTLSATVVEEDSWAVIFGTTYYVDMIGDLTIDTPYTHRAYGNGSGGSSKFGDSNGVVSTGTFDWDITGNGFAYTWANHMVILEPAPSSSATTLQLSSGVKATDLTVDSGQTFNANNNALTLTGNISSGGTFTGGSAAITAVDLSITAGTFTSTSGTLTLSGNYSNSGTFTNNSGTVTFTATDTGNTIGGTLSGTSDFSKLVFNGSGGEWTLGANLETDGASATAISIAAGTLKNGGYSITGNGATDTFSVSNGAFFEMSGTSAYPASFTTYTYGATSTVRYLQTSGLTVAAATYGHLGLGTTSDSTSVTYTGPAADFEIAGVLTLGNASDSANKDTFAGNSGFTLTFSGTGTPLNITAGGIWDAPGATVFTGTGADTTIASATYETLRVRPGASTTHKFAGNVNSGTLYFGDTPCDTGRVIDLATNNPSITVTNAGMQINSNGCGNDISITKGSGMLTFDVGNGFNVNLTSYNATQPDLGAVEVSGTGGDLTLGSHIKVTTLDINSGGIFSQGASYDLNTTGTGTAITVDNGGTWSNIGTGDIYLSGDVANEGTITIKTNNSAQCTDVADDITIDSTVDNTTRSWAGAGTFTIHNVNVDDMTGTITVYTSTLSGDTTWTNDSCGGGGITIFGTSNVDAAIVRVVVNGVLAAEIDTVSSGTFDVANVTVNSGEVVILFLTDGDGDIADASESTAVAKYDGTGDMTGIVLNANVLSIGSGDNQTITATDAATYDCDDDEDVMHIVSSNIFRVNGTCHVYSDELIQIESGNVLTISATETLTTDNLNVIGTLTQTTTGTISATGNISSSGTFNGGSGSVSAVDLTISGGTFASTSGTLSLSGNYSNSGTFTNNSGTVTFTATDTGNTINGTLSGTSDFSKIVFNGSGGEWTLGANLETDVNDNNGVRVQAGTLKNGGFSITGNGSSDGFQVDNGAFFEMSGTSEYPSSFSTYTYGATSTVRYQQTSVTITNATYGHLTLGGTGTYTLPASDITLRGNLSVTNNATVTKSASNKLIFAIGGGGTQTITDNNATKQNLGLLQISANSGNSTLSTSSDIKFTKITIDASQTFDISNDTITITGTGSGASRPLYNNGGSMTTTGSTVDFSGASSSMDIEAGVTYYNLSFTPGSGAANINTLTGALTVNNNFTINPSGGSTFLYVLLGGHTTVGNDLIIGNAGGGAGSQFSGTFAGNYNITAGSITVQASSLLIGNASTITVTESGTPFSISGTFAVENSTFVYAGTSATNVAATSYNHLTLNPTGGAPTYTLAAGTLAAANFTVGSNAVTIDANTNDPDINLTGDVTLGESTTWTKGSGLITFRKGGGGTQWVEVKGSGVTSDDLGRIQVSANSGNTTVEADGMKLTSLIIDDNQTFHFNGGYITGSGTGSSRPIILGTNSVLDDDGSGITYAGTSATEIECHSGITGEFLRLAPQSGSPTYTMCSSAGQTVDFQWGLQVGDGTNAMTLDLNTYDPNLTMGGCGSLGIQIRSNAIVVKGSGYIRSCYFDDDNTTKQDLGDIRTNTNADSYMAGSVLATTLTIEDGITFRLLTHTLSLTAASDPITGTGTLNTGTGTIEYVPDSGTSFTVPNFSYYNLKLSRGASTFVAPSTFVVSNNLEVNAGTLDLNTNDPALTVKDLTIGGTVSASATTANPLTITGNFTNNGTFTHNNGKVVINPTTTTTIGGSSNTTFYDLQSTAAGKTIQFKGGSTFGFAGALSVSGANGDYINLYSDSAGSQWLGNLTGTATITFARIWDAGCAEGSGIFRPHENSVDVGNNSTTCWYLVRRGPPTGASGGGSGSSGASGGGGSSGGSGGSGGSSGGSTTTPFSHWTLNDSSTTTAVDSQGRVNATITGATATPGKINGGYSFVAAESDYMIVSDTTDPTAYTYSVWIKPTTVSSQNIWVRTDNQGPNQTFSHMIRINSDGKAEHYTYDGAVQTVTGSTTLQAGNWYMITVTASNSGQARIYVNGVSEGTPATIGTLWVDGDRYYIGAEAGGGVYTHFNGIMDDIRYYNAVLSAEQILSLYNTGNASSGGGGAGGGGSP